MWPPNPDTNTTPADPTWGRHESFASYADCKRRPRNGGLFTGDQVLAGGSAIYTRQNPTGQRFGFECPEERDYYPYWGPSGWTDIAVLTSNVSECGAYGDVPCLPVNHTQVNRLGATYEGRSESSYLWQLPTTAGQNCVLRVRYNISLPSEMPRMADRLSNLAFRTNPIVFVDNRLLRLRLDTAQLGRTFEDRSYTFDIIPRPGPGPAIYNINVQGKRGNIAQVRNCFEYDFVPNNLTVNPEDFVHFQWVGSDFNPLGNDGQGRAGTDRTNLVEIQDYFGFNRIVNNTFIPVDLVDSFVFQNQILSDPLLNNASVYFNSRPFMLNRSAMYMCTRNNDFSNRNQKGLIIVRPHQSTTTSTSSSPVELASSSSNGLPVGYTALIIILSLGGLLTAFFIYRHRNTVRKKVDLIKRSLSTRV